jgi:hypothetical protein
MRSPRQDLPFPALVFTTARAAITHAQASGGAAIRLEGDNLVVRPQDADQLAAAGVYFAYLCDHHGQIMTVPVNG